MIISDEEVESTFKPKLTSEFLETLALLIEVSNWTLDASETQSLYRYACSIAGIQPRELDLTY